MDPGLQAGIFFAWCQTNCKVLRLYLKHHNMQKLISLLLLSFMALGVHAQTPVCCQIPTGMQALAMNDRFVAAHEEPIAMDYSARGSWVTLPVTGGKSARGYLVKAAKATDKWLLVCHEWWGLNAYIQQRSDELQAELGDVNVLAIDFYDGHVADKRDSAAVYMSSLTPARTLAICQAAMQYCGPKAQCITIGWCLGGSLSVQMAAATGKQGLGCVTYYGLPDVKTYNFDGLHCDIMGLFAGNDDWVNEKLINTFNEALKAHQKTMSIKVYKDAYHAFANPSNPKYDKEASADANKRALDYIKGKFAK